MPARFIVAEIGADDLVAEADVLADTAFIHDPVEVIEDRGRIGDALFMPPGFEIEAQRVHVAVRADAGIAEQIPRPAKIVAPLDDGIGVVRGLHFHVRGHADAGNSGTDDQHVEIWRCGKHGVSLPC